MVSPKGNVTGANPADYTTTYAYDADGRPTTTKEPLWVSSNPTAHRTVRTYDADGNLTQLTDGDNHTTTNHYDAADQLTSVTRPDNSVLSYGYDGDGNRASYTDGASHATTYHYDNAALPSTLTSETDPDNRTTTYGYDGAGNRVSSQDPGGNCSASPATGCTALGYDAAGQLHHLRQRRPPHGHDRRHRHVALDLGLARSHDVVDQRRRRCDHLRLRHRRPSDLDRLSGSRHRHPQL
jgi:YD repeat-containing protein